MSSPTAARCPVCDSTDCEDSGAPAYRQPTQVAGVAIDLSDLSLHHLRCRACGFRFVYPQIPAERLLACYQSAAQGNWGTDQHVATDRNYARKREVLEQFSPGKRVLDFGCFDGGFLEFLGDNWERLGIEPSVEAARVAESRGVRLIGATIDDVLASDKSGRSMPPVDAIIIFDVMEHLNDPVGTLRSLATFLRPGGIMVIETADSDSSHFARAGKYYPYCGFVDHVGFFNRSSIARVGDRAAKLELAHFESSMHSRASQEQARSAKMHNAGYALLRTMHRAGMPLGQRLGAIAQGPVPRSDEPFDHFLAVLRKRGME